MAQPILQKAHGQHDPKRCPIAGYTGPTECCEGKCRHRVNCNCAGGQTVDRSYVLERISSLKREADHWRALLGVH